MQNWLIPALGTFLLWGTSNFMRKLTVQVISARSAMIYEVIGGLIVALFVFASLNYRINTDLKGLGLGLITGILSMLGALCLLVAISQGQVSKVLIVTALYPIFSIILALLILGEPLSAKHSLGIFFGLLAMVLVAA